MFKQIMKYTLVAVIWKRYRALIVATVLLFIYFWLVGKIHQDYVAYSEMKRSVDNLGVSFTIKWAFLVLGQAIYFVFIALWRRSPKSAKDRTEPLQKHKADSASPRPSHKEADKVEETPVFQAVREKPKLRSRSDLIIEKYPKK